MFSFSATYLQINSGLQIPQNYKSLISNKKVFLYKYAKILTYKLMVIRGVVFMHWLMEQQVGQVVSAHVSHSALPIGMSHDCMTGSRCIDKHWAHGIQVLYKTFYLLTCKKQLIFTDDLKSNAKKQIWHTLFKFLTIIKGFQYCSKF